MDLISNDLGMSGYANQILDSLDAGIFVIKRDGFICFANRRSCEILGLAKEEILGTLVGSLSPEFGTSIENSDITSREIFSNKTRLECSYRKPDGEDVTIGFHLTAIGAPEEGEEYRHITILFQDITAIIGLREERDRLLQMAAVGHALPTLFHELKNPLAAITTAVEVLVEEVPEGGVQRDLNAILTEVRRMKLGFDGIGSVTRKFRSSRKTAVEDAIREAWQLLQGKIKKKRLHGYCNICDMPLLPLDDHVARAIVFNLVNNAIAACKPGDNIILKAGLIEEKSIFYIYVADTGNGMSPKVLKRCKEIFFTSRANGSGIGLALCTRAVEEAAGKLSIESVVGKGTNISIEIPLT